VFDPFFTTRRGQGGSGLGLHIVYNIVTGTLGGGIEVASELGRGTRFTLDIPTVAPEAEGADRG
jgi:signal transduction histidine kinase